MKPGLQSHSVSSSEWRSSACCCSCPRARSTTGRHGFSSPCSSSRRRCPTSIWLCVDRRSCGGVMQAGPTAETRPVQKIASVGYVVVVRGGGGGQRARPSVRLVTGADGGRGGRQCSGGDGTRYRDVGGPAEQLCRGQVTVEADQKVVSTGLYGLVRHPMYFGVLIMMIGAPLALDSYWGLVVSSRA